MQLESCFKVIKIKKKTSANLFKDTKVGDVLEVILDFDKVDKYRPVVYVRNKTTGQEDFKYLTIMKRCLDCFELERID